MDPHHDFGSWRVRWQCRVREGRRSAPEPRRETSPRPSRSRATPTWPPRSPGQAEPAVDPEPVARWRRAGRASHACGEREQMPRLNPPARTKAICSLTNGDPRRVASRPNASSPVAIEWLGTTERERNAVRDDRQAPIAEPLDGHGQRTRVGEVLGEHLDKAASRAGVRSSVRVQDASQGPGRARILPWASASTPASATPTPATTAAATAAIASSA